MQNSRSSGFRVVMAFHVHQRCQSPFVPLGEHMAILLFNGFHSEAHKMVRSFFKEASLEVQNLPLMSQEP